MKKKRLWQFFQAVTAVGILLAAGVARGADILKNTASAADESAISYTDPEAKQMLRSELVEFERYTESTMQSTLEILKSRKISSAELKKVDEWQSAQLKRFRSALQQDDPLLALVDGWAVGKSLSRYLEQNSVDGMSATTRDVGLDMVKRREERLAYIASRYLSPDAIDSLSNRLDAFTKEQPIPANVDMKPESRWWSTPFFSAWGTGQAAVESVFQMSLIPGRALKGVSDSGTALSGIRETTVEAVQVIDRLPANIRIEFQRALTDLIEKRSEIIEILSGVDSVSTNLRVTAQATHLISVEVQESLTLARELLPAGESLAIAVERAVTAATELVKVIGGDPTPGALPDAEDHARKGFDIAEYQRTATALTGAAAEVRLMLVEIRALVETSETEESDDDQSGFDVREYGAAADSIQHSTAEIRALISDLRGMTEDEVLRGRMAALRDEADAITQRSAERATKVVDHLTVRLIQTAFVVFFLACGYAFFQKKLRKN